MIKQIRYNKINCTGCGEYTSADLVAFDFGKVFREVLKCGGDDSTWEMLSRLDLKFYYTIRDICQELQFDMSRMKPAKLRLTVKDVIRQIEFLVDDIPFSQIKNETRESILYNNLYKSIGSTYGTEVEQMDAIEELIHRLAASDEETEIVNVDIQVELEKDEKGHEMPVALQYYIRGEKRELAERVCPLCGTLIDNQAGYRNEFIIGLAGLSRVGKTAFIAALIHQLKMLDSQGYICIKDENSESLNTFIQQVVSEYEKGNAVCKTEVENVDAIPLVYVPLQVGNREYNFVFVDMPGKIYGGSEAIGLDFISNKRSIIKNADVVWCCIEPAMIGQKYVNLNVVEREEDSSRQLSRLINVLNMVYNSKIPAGIIVTQSDLITDYSLFQPEENVMEQYLLEDYSLDWRKTKECMEKTRDFINQMNNFQLSIEDTFEGIAMFSVASYGFDVGAKALINNQKIRPSMIELPFLWTLAKLGLIKASGEVNGKDFFGKEKTTIKHIDDTNALYIMGKTRG